MSATLGVISFKMDTGYEGTRFAIVKEKETNKEIGQALVWLGTHERSEKYAINIFFDRAKFPNVKNKTDITLWQKLFDSEEEQSIEKRVHKLVIKDAED